MRHFRQSKSDQVQTTFSRAQWAYYRWVSWSLVVVAVLMVVGAATIGLLSAGDPESLWLFPFAGVSAIIGFAATAAYRWLGDKRPASDRSDRDLE